MEASGLYANRNKYGDFVHNAIQKLTATPSNVYIAVAWRSWRWRSGRVSALFLLLNQ